MDPMEFLREVWSLQGKGVGFLCNRRTTTSWFETAVDTSNGELERRIRLESFDGDVYFTPNLFRSRTRRKEGMLESRWLYADLDAVDPRVVDARMRPTVAWQSSPGRFQGMWLLPRPLPPEEHQRINKQLTYRLEADRSGWDATQVLRLPGTTNKKYDDEPPVLLLWWDERVVNVRGSGMRVGGSVMGPQLQVVELNGRRPPAWVKTKLRARTATGDRSKVLFKVECELLNRGFTKDEVFTLVRPSVWNKFDDRQLSDEIHRVAERVR